MLNGKESKSCRACYEQEEAGGCSYRQKSFESHNLSLNDLKNMTELDGSIKPNIEFIDLKPGKLCNLNCLMCFPELSTGVESDFIKLGKRDSKTITLTGTQHLWSNLKTQSKSLKRVNVSGGEPFINRDLLKYLDFLITSNLNKQIHISLISNLNIINDTILERLMLFDEVSITVSIDGLNKTAEFIRYPIKFSTFDSNLNKLIEHMKNHSKFNLLINTTCNVYNVHLMNEIFEYVENLKHKVFDHNLHLIVEPNVLDIINLPQEYKKQLIEKFQNIINENEILKEKFQQIVNRLEQSSQSTSWEIEFKKFNKDYSTLRSFSLDLPFITKV